MPFNSDLINNMDNMRISGTEHSSVILRQSSLKSDAPKRQNKVKPRCSQKRYKSSGVDRRTWLHVPSGTPAVTLTKYVLYQERLLLRCIHHFNLDSINNMDHMRISGTEPSSEGGGACNVNPMSDSHVIPTSH